MKSMVFSLLLAVGFSAQAETLCGWIENPTPANRFLRSVKGIYIISAQGMYEARGADVVYSKDENEFVSTSPSGSYGYYCGCIDGAFDHKKQVVLQVRRTKQVLLKQCLENPELPNYPKN